MFKLSRSIVHSSMTSSSNGCRISQSRPELLSDFGLTKSCLKRLYKPVNYAQKSLFNVNMYCIVCVYTIHNNIKNFCVFWFFLNYKTKIKSINLILMVWITRFNKYTKKKRLLNFLNFFKIKFFNDFFRKVRKTNIDSKKFFKFSFCTFSDINWLMLENIFLLI